MRLRSFIRSLKSGYLNIVKRKDLILRIDYAFLLKKTWREKIASLKQCGYMLHSSSFRTILLITPSPFLLLRHNMRSRHRADPTPLTLFVIARTEYAAILISKVVQLPDELAAPAALPVHHRCSGSFVGYIWASRAGGYKFRRWTVGWWDNCLVGLWWVAGRFLLGFCWGFREWIGGLRKESSGKGSSIYK